uniref:Integrase catalytic domain-containing protein n=1 Tax=Fagus sylvatica TaxID=28930 RepID=A0A2N9GKA7_FAGSY
MEAGDNSAQAFERLGEANAGPHRQHPRTGTTECLPIAGRYKSWPSRIKNSWPSFRSRGEIPSPGQGQNGEEIPRHETGRNQNQNQNQNDEGSSANQNREPHPSQVADPTKSAANARAAKLEEELKEMREQMKEMKSQVKAKAARNLDMLVHRSESPFTKRVDEYPLPAKFKVPQLVTFDGFKDPLDYLDSFRTIMLLHGVSDEIMCRTFPTNLRGSARTWFNQLETGSIDTFAQLSRAFIDNFIGGQRSIRPANYLLNIRQREGESLRSYVQRFNKEAVQIDEPNEYVALTAFNAGLLKGDFLFQLCKDPSKSMSKMILPKDREEEHKLVQPARRTTQGLHAPEHVHRPGLATDTRQSGDQVAREASFRPNKKIEALIKQGKAGKDSSDKTNQKTAPNLVHPGRTRIRTARKTAPGTFIGEIRTIVGGLASGGALRSSRKAYAWQAHNILVTQRSRKSLKMDDQVISFSEDDARNIHQPHDDALVVTLTIAGFITRRVLIDNGSSADIIYLPAYQQMKIDKEQLRPIDIPLVGFTGDKVKPTGVVSLTIEAGTYPKQVRTSVEFLVIDCPSAYNVIIGRPTLNKLRAVTSTYHLLVRFPTEHDIGELKGDQATARECYFASLGPETRHQTMKIDEGHRLVEPTEELEVIVLDDEKPHKTISIGTKVDERLRESMIKFLKDNLDVFAWTHDDMPGIDPTTICHKLNVDPSIRPIKQKRRVFAPDKNQAIYDEVEKLLTAGFIREVFYPDWLANVVMVKKANGKWRMLLTFMDAFSEYNQIMMDDIDQEKTSFITSKGLFCYKVMPFGLKNVGATYQRLMNKMFHHQIGRNVEVYIDDMLVKTKDEENHLEDLEETFETLRRYRMKLNPRRPKEVQSLTGRVAALNRFVSRATDKCLPFFKTLRKAFIWTDECQKSFEKLKEYLTSPPLLSPSQQGEALSLYLAVSPTAVSSALIRENRGTQLPVYYTSKAFQGAEERYPVMEKLALALVITARKLRPYFQSHKIIAIKAQALADFIAEFTVAEEEPQEEEPDKRWEVEIDGSSVKGGGGVGALLTGLRIAKKLGDTRLGIRSDSQLIVGQVNGEYKAREDKMTKYLKLVRNAMNWFDEVTLVQVPCEQNTEADALAKLASSDETTDQHIEVQYSLSHMEEEMSPVDVSNSWMTPIVNYLEDETFPLDPVETRKLKIRSARFTLMQGVLYKRGFSLTYLRCLDKAEANYVMREVHEGICGNHSGAHSLVHKLVRAGYYWPTMQKDAISYTRACDKCQRFGNLIHSPPEALTPMTAPWPFAQWGLDIMGPLPVERRQLKFLVVGIDYFTKWVEAEPLATITERNIRGFVWKAIICRFGIPRTFVSDNGRQFDNSPFREFCEELGIHNHYSSSGHPQANGQVEVTNRSLLKMIKTRLEGAKGLWPEELPNILWAYRTTARTPTGETPFRLAYGTEAVIPVEIRLTTWRTGHHDEDNNDSQLRLNLDLLDEVRDQAKARTKVYQQRMARYYDRRVKHKEFKVRDLVLRKVTLSTVSLKIKVIKTQDKEIKLKDNDPRHMRTKEIWERLEATYEEASQESKMNMLVHDHKLPQIEKDECTSISPQTSNDEEDSTEAFCLMAYEDEVCLISKSTKDKWFLDSGCSRHMTGDKNKFTSLTLKDGGNVKFGDNSKGKIIGIVERGVSTRSKLKNICNNMAFLSQIEPKNINEAIEDESWILAMQEELNQFERNKVWTLAPRPKDHSVIGTKWVFRNKKDEEGIIVRNKARLVAQGYNQEEAYGTPMSPSTKLDKDEKGKPVDVKLYRGDIELEFVSTDSQWADILTKPLIEERFCTIRREIGMARYVDIK